MRSIRLFTLVLAAGLGVHACTTSDRPARLDRAQHGEPPAAARMPLPPPPVAAPETTSEPASPALPTAEEQQPPRAPDVVFVPTPYPVVDKMLQMAEVKKGDLLYDLGCGDGRIVIRAAKRYGLRAEGFDIDPKRVAEAKRAVKEAGVEHLVTIHQADIFELDLSPANVVTLYLLPKLNVKLIPQLEKLRPGARIVSHDFDMEGVEPEKSVAMKPPGEGEHSVFMWRAPIRVKQREATR